MMYSNIYEIVIAHYGNDAQLRKTIEELKELETEIRRGLDKSNQFDRESLIEEMADVHNMFIQLRIIFDIKGKEIENKMAEKMRRTMKRIKEEGVNI